MEKLKIIRLPKVCKKIGLSKPTIYRLMKQGNFPQSVQLSGARSVGWIESEINKWIKSRVN